MDQKAVNTDLVNRTGRLGRRRDEMIEADPRRYAGRLIAQLTRCGSCHSWWASSDQGVPETQLIFQLVEPFSRRFLWEDYRGWRKLDGAHTCPACGSKNLQPAVTLTCDAEGQLRWPDKTQPVGSPEQALGGNLFRDYVAGSERMEEHFDFMAAREAQHKKNAWGYTADIDDIREEMNAMRDSFKEVVYRYAPLLPPGWRVSGDFDKWLKGQACAGFLQGEMQPANSLLVGGQCHTVADIEIELDRLYRFICDFCC